MAVPVTGREVLDHLLLKRGIGQKIVDAEYSATTTALTSVYNFRNINWGENELINIGAGFWRPANVTGQDEDWRPCGVLNPSTGAVTVDTWAVAPTTEDVYQLNYRCHPRYVREAMNVARNDVYFACEYPVSLAADADFGLTATTAYTESDADGGPATTFSKVSTDSSYNVYPGFRASGRVLNAAANGYIRQRFNVHPGQQIYVAALARADVGTAELGLHTVGGSEIGTNITHTGEAWAYMERVETMPAGTEELEVRLRGDGTTDDIYWQGLWVLPLAAYQVPITGTIWDVEFKATTLAYLDFGHQLSTGVYDARSARKVEIPREDWDFYPSRPGANAYSIQFHNNRYMGRPIIIQGRRPHSDVDTAFSRTLAETTSADLDLFEAAVARRLFSDERIMLADRIQRLTKAEYEFNQLSQQFRWNGPAKPKAFAFNPSLR